MRKVLLCLVMVLFATWATVQAQEVITLTGNMEEELTPGSTYAFYDSGGPSADYGTSQSYTATFTCTGSITINFSSFATESSSSCYNWDYMLIYDGNATEGELLGRLQTGCASATITTNVDYVAQSGTLTIEWHSDGSTTAAGWEATITTEASAGQTCDKPESVEANDVTSNSATINWIGTAAAYNLQYKGASDADWTLLKNLTGGSYQLTGLVSNTAYQVQVQAICGENTSGWKAVSFNTLIGLPYAEHFNGTSAPSGWTVWSGQLQADGSATRTSSSVWSFGSNNGVFDNHARANIYGTGCYRWLQTPAIPIPEMEEDDPGFQMYFNLALTKFSGTLVEVDKTLQQDDRFIVLASIDEGANWTILREWNNTGSSYVYNDIAVAGEEVEPIDLSAYAGQTVLLAFYGESTVAGGDNNIHVDDVVIEKTPTCLKPTALHAVDGAATSSTLPVAWTANSNEENWRLQYKPTADSTAVWTTLDIAANPYPITGLSAFTEYEIRVAAVCTAEDYTDYGKSIFAKTAAVVPFAQSFDTTAMPGEWKRYEALLEEVQQSGASLVAATKGWSVGTQNGVFSNEHLYLNIKDSTKYWLVSPVIEMSAGYQLTFDLALTTKAGSTPTAVTAGEQNDDMFIVLISTNGGEEWEALGTWGNQGQGSSFDGIKTEGQTIKFDLSEYAGQSILLAFYGESTEANGDNNLHISNVAIDLIPACERPLSITIGEVTGSTASISWDADEDGQWEYGYVANPAADFTPAASDYTGSTGDMYVDLTELAETTDYIFFVRRACDETEKSEPLMKTFKTLQTPAALPYSCTFEDGNGWLLINGDLPNQWAYGTAVAKTGTHALYVSNDHGLTHAYTFGTYGAYAPAMVYATKTFYFEETGMYSFSFDWLCKGSSYSDYMRVALAPISVDPEAATTAPTDFSSSSLPEGWIALDGGSQLVGSDTWQSQLAEINIENVGNYKVIIAWRNDNSSGTNPPGAIDNIKISRILCPRPAGLTVSNITFTGASFDWNEATDGMKWVYACVPASEPEPADDQFIAVEQNSLTLSDLESNTNYVFYLRKNCVADGLSESVSVAFKTLNPFQIVLNNGTTTNEYVPFYGYYVDQTTKGQFIIPAAQLENIQWDSIQALTFFTSSPASKDFGAARFDVYMAEVDYTTMSGVVDLSSLHKVMSNKALSIADNQMYVALDSLYQYKGGNLLVAFNQLTSGSYANTYWYGVSAPSGSAAYVYGNSGSTGVQSFLPKTAIDFKHGAAPACATPKALHAIDSLITANSAVLAWTPLSPETNWVIRYREEGAEEWQAVVPVAADTFKLLEGLDPATIYEAQVATQCDEETIGDYSSSIFFVTECVPVAEVSEDFEGNLLCWSAIQDESGYPGVLANYPAEAYSGTKFLYFYSKANDNPVDEYVVLPELISLNNMRLKFMACNDYELSTSIEGARLVVGVMPAAADSANFVALDTIELTSNVYSQFIIPFTAYTGDGKFVAIKMLAASQLEASALIDDVVVEEIPGCLEPTALVVVADSLKSNAAVLSWKAQGSEDTWIVRYKKAADQEWNTPVLASDTTLKIENLEAKTTYEAQVAAWCDPSSEEAKSPFTTSVFFTTAYGVPFLENFTATGTPADWSQYTGWLDSISAGVAQRQSGSGWTIGTSNGVFDRHAYVNIYGTTCNKWLQTPAIELQAGIQLTFDLALTKYSGTAAAVTKGSQADDRFVVLYSLDNGESWSILREWNNTGSEYIYDDIATTGQEIKIVLDDNLAGKNVIFAFYGESSVSGGDNNLHVDNVKIAAIPSCERPLELVVTATEATSVTLEWNPQGNEAAWMIQYKKAADEEWITLDEAATVHPYTLEGLESATAYEVRVAAKCGDEEISEYTSAISFLTECLAITTYPYAEGFDSLAVASNYAHTLPICWSYINTCTYSSYSYYPTVYDGTSYANSPNNSLKFYSSYSSYTDYDPQDQYAILPQMEGLNGLRIKFNARKYSSYYSGDSITVGIMTDPSDAATFVAIQTIKPASTSYAPFEVLLNAYTGEGQYIAFKMLAANSSVSTRGLYLDDIVVEEIPSCLEPTGLMAIDSLATSTSVVLRWTAQNAETAWTLQYKKASDEEWITVSANTNPYELSGLEAATLYDARVAAVCGDTESSVYSSAVQFATACGVYELPFADNFSALTSGIPLCWDNSEGTTTSEAYKWNYYASAADTCVRFNSYSNGNGNTNILATPEIALTADATLTFRWKNPTGGAAEIFISNDGGQTRTSLENNLTSISSWTPYEFDLADYTGDTVIIYFKGTSNYGNGDAYLYLDDVAITLQPACGKVKNIAVSEITAASAILDWSSKASAWQIVYSADPNFSLVDVEEADIYDVAVKPYALSELLSDTLYNVYVRANCGDEGFGEWSDLFTFHTASDCQMPDNLVASDITMNSAVISWNTYGQSSFNLRYSTNAQDWTLIEEAEMPYTLTDLAPSTKYYVQVQVSCAEADMWSSYINVKTAYVAPFYEPFAASTIPADWSEAQGLMADVLDGEALTTGSIWAFGTNNNVFDSHARINIYGTTRKHWLMTPAIYSIGNNQLTFDLALTVYTYGSSAAPTAGGQPDDKFAVLISTDGGATWALLREWNNSGSEYVYDAISNAGEEVAIDLTAYAGEQIMIGFYGESTVSNGDNNLHIDNVRIDAIPTCIKPTGLTISDVFAHSATLAWESDAAAWQIALDTIAGFNPDTLSTILDVTENPYTLTNLLPSHTYYVYVRANCGETDGVSVWTAKQSFTTTIACPAPTGLAAELTPGDGSIATLTWNAGEAQEYQVEYSLNSNMLDSVVLNVTESVIYLTGLTAEQTYYARVKAVCGEEDGESAYSAVISFLPTNIYSIVVNDGAQTNSYVPIYGTYVDEGNTASQFIVPAESLQEILWDSITELTFYSSNASIDWGAAEFEVYMTTTEDATLGALVDWNSLTQVMIAGNLSIVNNKMVVTLSEQFQYTGDNLLIGFKQTAAGSYVGCSWYGKNTTGASIGGYGTGNNMTQRNFLPKMTINYVPGQAPSCMWATHLEVSDITKVGATFSWDEVEGANWEYAVVLASSNEAPTAFAQATTNPLVLDNLDEATAYVFYLRNNCGDENSKLVSVAFSTIEDIQALPYSTDFSDAAGWKFANNANGWVINGELFVSNDGTTYGYDNEAASVSFATKLFNFEYSGTYTISYDWKCVGEYDEEDGANDFMRAALVPADVELTAGVAPEGLTEEYLPAGWIAIDENAALVNQEESQHKSVVVPVTGLYRVVFVWINDGSVSNGVPAAIDNLSISHKSYPTDIEGANAGKDTKAIKFIRDNHVYIMLNGKVYNVTGQAVELK
ncbi:MAG: fibronectin type III domain-containing protein [Paludibacteraceae bacterium]|nr:fibronectin type III domain-containing protein [Paludibacteraceae bacterium]